MRRLKTRSTSNDLTEIRRNAVWLIDNIDAIVNRANSDSDEAINSGGNGMNSGHSDPTAVAATTFRTDPAGDAAKTLTRETSAALRAMRRALQAGQSLMAIPQSQAISATSYKAKPNASTTCANLSCQRPIENIEGDRAREGRCSGCYQYRRAHNGNERPRALCHPAHEDAPLV